MNSNNYSTFIFPNDIFCNHQEQNNYMVYPLDTESLSQETTPTSLGNSIITEENGLGNDFSETEDSEYCVPKSVLSAINNKETIKSSIMDVFYMDAQKEPSIEYLVGAFQYKEESHKYKKTQQDNKSWANINFNINNNNMLNQQKSFIENNPNFGKHGHKKGKENLRERMGDWTCSKCKNSNFKKRKYCNMCRKPKFESDKENLASLANQQIQGDKISGVLTKFL